MKKRSEMPSATEGLQKNISTIPRLRPRTKQVTANPQPVPDTPLLPSPQDAANLTFELPRRRILTSADHAIFQSSGTHSLILAFVFKIAESARDRSISSINNDEISEEVRTILSILDHVSQTVKSVAPADQGSSRFGNPAFRPFLDAISVKSDSWHRSLGFSSDAAVSEVSEYLLQSFGNRARIDYGSGHELNFIVWLLCLNRLSLLPESTFPTLALLVFPRYIRLMRDLQITYYLEPAGSHGVWGLDDYHFLPFLFGASQLLHHPYIRPLSIHNELVLEEESDEYLYLDMVRWTVASKSVKGLKWTQPMLDDISAAKSWEKVENGMRRMFVKEVLGKLPIMQHFLFGSLIPAVDTMGREAAVRLAPEDEEAEAGEVAVEGGQIKHVHRSDAWGDCCGIKIPSTIAAAVEAKKQGAGGELRRIPFD